MKKVTINNLSDFKKISPGTLLEVGYAKFKQGHHNACYVLTLLMVVVNKYNDEDTPTNYYAFNKKIVEPIYLFYLGMTDKGLIFLDKNRFLKFRIGSADLLKFPFDIKVVG